MRKYLFALLFCVISGPALAQCNGVFSAGNVCGNSSTSSKAPSQVSASSLFGLTPTIKAPCTVATTGNITLSGEQSIDGITTSSTRVCVWQQTTGSQNGIWTSSSGAWSRTADATLPGSLSEGTQIYVNRGATNATMTLVVSNTGQITPGTTAITFNSYILGAYKQFYVRDSGYIPTSTCGPSDACDCLSSQTACSTIQGAINKASKLVFNRQNVTINIRGTYNESAVCSTALQSPGTNFLKIDGGDVSLTTNNSSSGSAFTASGNCQLILQNMTVGSSQGSSLTVKDGGVMTLNDMNFLGANGGIAADLFSNNGTFRVNSGVNWHVKGSGNGGGSQIGLFHIINGGRYLDNGHTITFDVPVSYATGTLACGQNSFITTPGMTFVNPGNVTGRNMYVHDGCNVDLGGIGSGWTTYWPGSLPYFLDATSGGTVDIHGLGVQSDVLVNGPTIGSQSSAVTGNMNFIGKTSGASGKLTAQDAFTTGRVWTLPDATGTIPVTASSPLAIDSVTGNITCASCSLLNVQTFTASGTYTPTSGVVKAIVELRGGGGGGGGIQFTGATKFCASGGGGGELARLYWTSPSSQTVTIGAGGTAGSTSGGNGGTGGTTSLGSVVTAIGGAGGGGQTTNSTKPGGAGGTGGTGATISIPGVPGGGSTGNGGTVVVGGNGGGQGGGVSPMGSDANGGSGSRGGGGAGACSNGGGTNQTGGVGGDGWLTVYEYR